MVPINRLISSLAKLELNINLSNLPLFCILSLSKDLVQVSIDLILQQEFF